MANNTDMECFNDLFDDMDTIEYEYSEVVLRDYQVEHFERMKRILKRQYCAIDNSDTGNGKTYVGAKLFQEHLKKCKSMRMIVVGPSNSYPTWSEVNDAYNLGIMFYTYAAIRGSSDKPKHGLFTRHCVNGDVTYKATAKLREYVKDGLFLVIDEGHNIKNKSEQSAAVRVLTNTIMKYGGHSRFLIAGATTYDKKELSVNFLRSVGILPEGELYHRDPSTGIVELKGFRLLFSFAKRIDAATLKTIRGKYSTIDAKTSKLIAHDIYTEIVVKHLSSAMVRPLVEGGPEHDVKNIFMDVPPNSIKKYNQALKDLAKAREENKTFNVMGILNALEVAKRDLFVNRAKELLQANNTNKVAIYVRFINTLDYACDMLKEYNPVVFRGGVKMEVRRVNAKKFREDPDCRLVICTIGSASSSISFHDTVGGYERWIVASNADYSAIDTKQLAGRCNRDGAMSDSHVEFIYGKGSDGMADNEYNILDKRNVKSTVISSTMYKGNKSRILLPHQYGIVGA